MKIQLLVIAAVWAFAGLSHAQPINGSLVVNTPSVDFGIDGPGSFVSGGNSFQLFFSNNLQSSTGDFTAPINSDVGSSGTVVSGLSSTPTAENIPDFIEFYTTLGSSSFRFGFDLTSITETNAASGAFTGLGTLVDTTGVLQSAPAFVNIQFTSYNPSGSNGYYFSLQTGAVPEPSSWALGALAFALLVFLRFRLRAKA